MQKLWQHLLALLLGYRPIRHAAEPVDNFCFICGHRMRPSSKRRQSYVCDDCVSDVTVKRRGIFRLWN